MKKIGIERSAFLAARVQLLRRDFAARFASIAHANKLDSVSYYTSNHKGIIEWMKVYVFFKKLLLIFPCLDSLNFTSYFSMISDIIIDIELCVSDLVTRRIYVEIVLPSRPKCWFTTKTWNLYESFSTQTQTNTIRSSIL